MISIKLLTLITLLVAITFYIISLLCNAENKEIRRVIRWVYYWGVIVFTVVFSIFIGSLFGLPIIIFAALGVIPGLVFCLPKVYKVMDNEVIIIQNHLFTQKRNGTPTRLFAKGGLTPLLHGEIVRGTWENEVRKLSFKIRNVETKDSTPLDVSVVVSIAPNFDHFQEILQVSHSQNVWWDRVFDLAKSLITSRVSDLLKETDDKTAVESKTKMSEKLVSEKVREDYLFTEEIQFGFKIVNVKFADIDYTDAVIKANEQVLKASAYGLAARKLLEESGVDIESIDDKEEQMKLVEASLNKILASDNKIKLSVFDIKGGENSEFLRTRLVADNVKK